MFQGHAQCRTHRALSILVFIVTLLLTFAYPWDQGGLVFAQGMPPAGSFGFLLNQWQAGGSAGTAILGVVNFDGGGNVTGTYTVEIGGQPAQTLTGTLTGTYSTKPDGTGTLGVTLDVGVTFSYAMAVTDGGQGLQLVETACTGCGGGGSRGNGGGGNGGGGGSGPSPISLQGTAQSITGSLPAGFFVGSNATGSMQVAMEGANGPGPNGGETIYTVTSGTGSGTVPNCPNGQGNWSASQKTLTIVVSPPVSSFGANGGSVSGTYISAIAVIFCGGSAASTTYFLSSGSVSGTVSPQGNASLIIGGNGGGGNGGGGGDGGSVTSGTARAISTTPPSGSYGFQLNKSPSAEGVVGIMKFDGAGNVTGSFTDISGGGNQPSVTGTFTGTYSANPDGSGALNIGVVEGGQSENIKFAVVPTDGGSGILFLQTSGTENSVLFGSGRLQ